ncbi:ABC transporter permease [Actinopolymorpha pittospori]|uniref:Peptide/nickel transport system permease protein n=1 Tax=Actinopolymorpha pittospori TaxID=648752 RepID=A0A927N6S3_9ACTN|nr:ABC transporter permease [Actinopolymorpha pittospori]MBE1613199.1 peptide/nickel transport system permease protein [Actinopolymorpha pittospori]
MTRFVIRRILYMIPTLFVVSVAAFAIIQLPPGDYLTTLKSQLEAQGQTIDQAQLAALEDRYGLGDPFYVQYLSWMGAILLHGDFGQSFEWNRPVSELLADRLPLTMTIAIATLLFTWLVAFPIGVYTAVRKYSLGDYTMTFVGFLGLAVPNFMLALIFSYVGLEYFGQSVGGLFSPEYVDARWNIGKILDLLQHLWVPILVLGAAGTAGIIRILRANLLDELRKPYVVTARAKGLRERTLLFRYPTRIALNPFVSTVGWVLPSLVGGEIIVSQVLGLDTTGPLLLRALQSQDMYLAGSLILVLSVLTVIGTLLSDILLALIDPRIRYRYQ